MTNVEEITLISVTENTNYGNWRHKITTQQGDNWSFELKTLHGGMQEGVQLLIVNNGVIEITFIPTRGMNIYSVTSEHVTLGWDSPVREIVHPRNVNLLMNNCKGWLYSFNEWLSRCGLEYSGHPVTQFGNATTLHGCIAHQPTSEVSIVLNNDENSIEVKGTVKECSFKGVNFELKTSVRLEGGSTAFSIEDRVINHSSCDAPFQLLYHANYAKELLEEGSQLYGTIESVKPFQKSAVEDIRSFQKYGPPADSIAEEKVYLIKPFVSSARNKALFLLENAQADVGVSMAADIEELPYFTQWKNEDSLQNGYVTGLEFGNTYPASPEHEKKQGRVPTIRAGEEKCFSLDVNLLLNRGEVARLREEIAQLMEGRSIEFDSIPEWR